MAFPRLAPQRGYAFARRDLVIVLGSAYTLVADGPLRHYMEVLRQVGAWVTSRHALGIRTPPGDDRYAGQVG
jgi:hypothetical protein